MPRKLTTEEFVQRSIAVHGNKYGYDSVEYISSKDKVAIACPEHGVFYQTPHAHLRGEGCPQCATIVKGNSRRKTTEDFVESAIRVHGERYDYSKVNYVNNRKKVEIVCPTHGSFFQSPHNHILEKQGCPICGVEKCKKSNTYTKEKFIGLCKKVHGDKYDYSKVDYVDGRTKVLIGCRLHGYFSQIPNNHLNGVGCPHCSESKGQRIVGYMLRKLGVRYETEKKFPGCKDKRALKFDFYLPDYNMCIEYQGLQHYQFAPIFHDTEEKFATRLRRDQIKRDYCASHGIRLVEIRYDQDIEEELKQVV